MQLPTAYLFDYRLFKVYTMFLEHHLIKTKSVFTFPSCQSAPASLGPNLGLSYQAKTTVFILTVLLQSKPTTTLPPPAHASKTADPYEQHPWTP